MTRIPDNRSEWSAAELAAALQGTLHGDPAARACGVVIDSRRVERGSVFVAVRGERMDGHRFLDAAAYQGATIVVVRAGSAVPVGPAVIEVADTVIALGAMARAHRRRWGGKVVAITGSVGKTTAKELTLAALGSAGCRVAGTQGNLNNHFGLPMTLLSLDSSCDTAVVELGSSGPGEIAKLAAIAQPDVAAVTRAELVHSQGLLGIDAVAAEKSAIYLAGTALVPADDARVRERVPGGMPSISFGFAPTARVRLEAVTIDASLHTHATVLVDGKSHALTLGRPGEAFAYAGALAMAATLALCGPDALEAAASALAGAELPAGRMRPLVHASGALVLDDSYNASPVSMRHAIATASSLAAQRGGELHLALGDMLELGEESARAHAAIIELALQCAPAHTFLCGAAFGAARAEETPALTWLPDDPAAAASALNNRLGARDVLLVKGSRGIAMEALIEALGVAT